MATPLALIIDDEPDIRELLSITLTQMGLSVTDCENVASAKAALDKQQFNLCFTDMRLPDGDGLEVVRFIQQYYPNIPVAVITAYGNMELAVSALKAGAFDFVSKPVDLQNLRDMVKTALKLPDDLNENNLAVFGLLGKTQEILALSKRIHKLARSQAPVYISGGSGSGKELVARLIHQLGPRDDAPFVPVNCGAIPEHLMESEFFGHKKGSFTGAIENKQGLFQAADGGTLFLDEVADLPLAMQVKLLRAIQEKAIRPIGGAQEVSVDVRILSATHKNLHALVKAEQFRQDLFYRINVIELAVPALKERADDIPLLAEHILDKLCQQSAGEFSKLSPAAIDKLTHYDFPGNVRELENILERAMTLCENHIITAEDIQLGEHDQAQEPLSTKQEGSDMPLEHYLDDLERQKILTSLDKTNGNKTQAAKLLGITLRALRYRLKKLGLE